MSQMIFKKLNLDYLGKRFEKMRFPLQAEIELTCKCNLKCVHCYARPNAVNCDLSTEKVKNIIDLLYDQETLFITFTGGEIFTRKDFKEIYLYAKNKGMMISLLTNITLLTQELLDLFAEYPPLIIETSIYGLSQDVYERVTQVKGSYSKFIHNLKLLIASGINYKIKYIAIQENYADVDFIKQFENKYKTKIEIYTNITKAYGEEYPLKHRLNMKQLNHIWTKYMILNKGKSKNKEINEQWKYRMDHKYLYPCNAGYQFIFITHTGKVQPCISMYYHQFDIFAENFDSLWKKIKVVCNKK